jgi:hypothetical protein
MQPSAGAQEKGDVDTGPGPRVQPRPFLPPHHPSILTSTTPPCALSEEPSERQGGARQRRRHAVRADGGRTTVGGAGEGGDAACGGGHARVLRALRTCHRRLPRRRRVRPPRRPARPQPRHPTVKGYYDSVIFPHELHYRPFNLSHDPPLSIAGSTSRGWRTSRCGSRPSPTTPA